MKFVTETRLKLLEDLVQLIPERKERSYALHLLNSIRCDIDENYAEIQSPISLRGASLRTDDKKHKYDIKTHTVTLE